MNKRVLEFAETIKAYNGVAMLVGGSVRDMHLNLPIKDYDFEVFGIEAAALKKICQTLGIVNEVGESYSVLKVQFHEETFDVAIPRVDRKIGKGHKNFEVSADHNMSYENAARRRDFSINALMYNPLTDETLDFFGGLDDIKNKVIRHVDANTFVEDSLRVLRACQFAARLKFLIADETVKLCQSIDLSDLPAERIREELFKLLLKSDNPSVGIQALVDTGASQKLFNSLFCDKKVYWNVLNSAAKTAKKLSSAEYQLTLMLSALMFKFDKKEIEFICDKLQLYTINNFKIREQLFLLNEYQQYPYIMPRIRKNYQHLVNTGVNIGLLTTLYQIFNNDSHGFFTDFIDLRLPLKNGKIAPLLEGEDLLKLGFKEGKELGAILKEVYQKQLDDEIQNKDEAFNYVGRNYQYSSEF